MIDIYFSFHNNELLSSNFKVIVNEGISGTTHNGTGKLCLPSVTIGNKFLRIVYTRKKFITLNSRRLNFRKTDNRPPFYLLQELVKTPYMSPDLEEERERKLRLLSHSIHVDKLQFGVFYRPSTDNPKASRRYSNEYEVSFKDKSVGILWFEYDHKLIRIQVRYSPLSVIDSRLSQDSIAW